MASADAVAMSQAAQSLKEFWRTRAPDVAVEHFAGDQRLALLSHINQSIAQLGLNQAMQKPQPPGSPRQIAIITHAEQLPASDVQMLQDLTLHLPGLCWRWVLLHLDNPANQPDSPVTSIQPLEPSVPPSHHGAGWGLAGLVALLFLGLWGAWLRYADAPSGASLSDQRPTPAATAAASGNPSGPAAGAASEVVSPAQATASALQTITPEDANTPKPAAARMATAASETAPVAPSHAAAPVAVPKAEVPDVALRGVRWLAQLAPDFYVLEHGEFDTAAQAQSLIKTRAELANARVIMRKSAALKGPFLVITGPFRTPERAQNFKVRENLPLQIPVRRVSDVLQESVRATPSPP